MTCVGSFRGGVRRSSCLPQGGCTAYDGEGINMVEIANNPRTRQHSTPVSRVPFTGSQTCEAALQQALGYCEVLCEQGPAVAPRRYQVWKTLPACERDKSDAAVRDKFRHLRTGVLQGQPL